MSLSPDEHEQVKRIYLQACALSGEERAAFLERACGGDAALRSEVETFLGAASHSAILPELPATGLASALATFDDLASPPERIGDYRILGVLGHGGMGVVYRARQPDPDREVALKVVRPGADAERRAALFAEEAAHLARLQHPGIAQIHAAGVARGREGPRPFFVMELIDGQPLLDFARDRRLDPDGRVRLLIGICDAVHHAHQRGVIHRDLKPANILVDARGQPKVLDFGIATVRGDGRDAASAAGTPGYISPEQLGPDPPPVDVRDDVYALGVIGAELVAGEPTDPDLDLVIATARERNREARYASAEAFAADLQRVLECRPVSVRRPTAGYVLGRYVRRHAVLVTVAGLAVLALLAGIAGTSLALLEAREAEAAERTARENAQKQADRAEATLGILEETFAAIDPLRDGPDFRVVELMERLDERLLEEPVAEPEVDGRIRAMVGNAYRGLTRYPEALRALQRSHERLTEALGADHPETLRVEEDLAVALRDAGELEAAAEHLEHTLVQHRRLGEDHERTIRSLGNLAQLRLDQGRGEEAHELARRTVALALAALGEDHEVTLVARGTLGQVLYRRGELAAAEAELRRAMTGFERTAGEDDPRTLLAAQDLAVVLAELGRTDEADALRDRALQGIEREFGPRNIQTLIARANRAAALLQTGDLAQAERLLLELLPVMKEVLGDDHPELLVARNTLAVLYKRSGRNDEARALYEDNLEAQVDKLGPGHADTRLTRENLGRLLMEEGDHARAAELFEESVEQAMAKLGEGHDETHRALFDLAMAYRQAGRSELAETTLRRLVDVAERTLGDAAANTQLFRMHLARCLLDRGALDEADRLLALAHDHLKTRVGPEDRATLAVQELRDVIEQQRAKRKR